MKISILIDLLQKREKRYWDIEVKIPRWRPWLDDCCGCTENDEPIRDLCHPEDGYMTLED